MAILASIEALPEKDLVIEPAKAQEATIACQKSNPYQIRFTVNRMGHLAHARFLEEPTSEQEGVLWAQSSSGIRDRADKNVEKHQVAFSEAATVFGDPLSMTFADPDHSIGEERFITVGLSRFGNLLIVSHADRGDCIRIISARRVTRRERTFYEEHGQYKR